MDSTGNIDSPQYYVGRLLLAMPGMSDGNFDHAVIALCAHDAQGAMGIDIGSAIPGLGLRELLANFDIDGGNVADNPVLRGGPVEPQRGFVLHSTDWNGQDMLSVAPGWALSGSLDILKAIGSGTGPTRYLVALGYAGWRAGQLEGEMTRHGWFLGEPFDDEIWGMPAPARWAHGFAECGVDARLLAAHSGNA
jgi:putative transcriptional regulator